MDVSDKQRHTKDSKDWPTGWDWFVWTDPVLWISALIAFGITYAFDIPRDSQLAIFVFVAALISVFALFKIVLVYIFARSLRRGSAPSIEKTAQPAEQAVARKRRAEPNP